MGRVDQFVAGELSRIEEKVNDQKKLEESYRSRAKKLLSYLRGYIIFNGVGESSPAWLVFFYNFLSKAISSPRIISYFDDFVIKQLESLIEKCDYFSYFLEGFEKFFGWTLIYFPLLFFAAVYLLSGGHSTLFWLGSAIALLLSLIDDYGRKVAVHHFILLAAAFIVVKYFPPLLEFPLKEALALIELYGFIINLIWARRFALSQCASAVFPVSYLTVEEFLSKFNSQNTSS
ncbi:hypothetical protein [Thermovibrio sp.]